MEIAILILLVVLTVLVVLLLLRKDPGPQKLSGELALLSKQCEMEHKETMTALDKLSEQMQKLTEQNYGQQNKMLQTVTQALTDIQDKNRKENELIRETLQKNLDQIRGTVEEKLTQTLSTRLDASFKTVSDQLENVYKSLGEMKELSSGVTENVSGLNRILTNVKARGTWGEAQLQNILEDIIPNMYDTNVATNPGKLDRVEFAVRIPTGDGGNHIYLPIDSKFPMEDYARLIAASDAGDTIGLTESRKALKNRVLAEAKDVSGYIHEPETTSFAILYLATEGLYAEIAGDEALVAKIRSLHSVMIAGPSTIAALLNSLAMGFRTVAINRKAEEVRTLLVKVKAQYGKFEDLLTKAQKKIDEAGKVLGDAKHRNDIIHKSLNRVESLPAMGAPQPDPIPELADFTEISPESSEEE
ncbi:MAG: DNA recombination protein RmuC [Clostridia bacterium]|nr:DNA recombination protein RmuC [Clostridia bacterium]